jgi:hypothetical protein
MKHAVSLMVSLFFVLGMLAINASADVNINIGISAPPVVFAAPPDVVVVPSDSSYVYMTADTPGIYFYDDYWYRFYGGHWFRATIYNGPWVYIATSLVPVVVVDIPPYYVHYLPRGYHRIHYRDLHSHWQEWHRDRYWNRYDWYRKEVREHERRHREGYKQPRGQGYKPPHSEGYKPPRGGQHNPPPGSAYKPPEQKGHKPQGEGHKPKGEHKQKGNKGEHNEER